MGQRTRLSHLLSNWLHHLMSSVDVNLFGETEPPFVPTESALQNEDLDHGTRWASQSRQHLVWLIDRQATFS